MLLATATLVALGVAGCASSTTPTASPSAPSTTAPCTTPTTPTNPRASNQVVPTDGTGEQTVQLPRDVALPAIVHARYTGHGTFGVDSQPADGVDRVVLVASKGAYEGTFPVGFVEEKCAPTTALHVEADGPWHLDIANASLAPRLTTGFRGKGDAVLAYRGPKAPFHVSHSGKTSFVLRTYGAANTTFARSSGGADAIVQVAAGPLFLAVTTVGDWSIAPA
jgi:hypothetical protein